MKVLTDEEATLWCKQWPVNLKIQDGRFGSESDRSCTVDVSKLPWRDLLPTARSLAHLGCHSTQEFSGLLIWIRRIGIAVPEMENVIVHALERFRAGYGENRPLETARGHLFRAEEAPECSAAVLLVLLAEWEAYLVHPVGLWFAFIDNDNHVTVTAKSVEVAQDLKESLQVLGEILPTSPPF